MTKLTIDLISEAKKRGKITEHEEDGIAYARFREDFHSIPRGTVFFKSKRIIWGYPHIKRIFTLENGILKNIKSEAFYVEEKIDGFNLRVARIGANLFAFSRGGFIDWFATEKVREMNFGAFFKSYPEYILCSEMIGNTPHTPPTTAFDVKLLVFDIDEGDGSYLKPREKYDLLKKYKIESVPLIGLFKKSEIAKLRQVALMMLKKKKEGIVIKSDNRSDTVKYVTLYADIDDIARNMPLMFDMPAGFFIQRVLRSAFFLKDFGLGRDEYARRLGIACYESLIEKLRDVENGARISEDYEISIKNLETWNKVLKHMSREVKIEVISKKQEGEKTRIRFKKIYKKTDRELRGYLAGKGVID